MKQEHLNSSQEDINLFDYLNIIVKHRWMILRNVAMVAVLVFLISFILPKSYTAETTILPPDEMQQNEIWSVITGSPLSQLGIPQPSSTSDLFVQIMKSRTVFDNILQTKFNYKNKKDKTLLSIFKLKSLEKARKKLNKAVSFTKSTEGIIRVKVELPTPELAADVANAFIAELDEINQEKNTSRAKNSRIYIEHQLELTEKKLKEASDALAKFKEQYKAVSLEEQTKTAIEKAGEIKGNIIAKEVEMGVALQTMKPDNVYIIKLRKEIEELKKQYNYLQFGDSISLKEKKEFYIPFSQVPEVGLELAELVREVKVQETVWELLNQQYYQAKIQEARDTPTVQVLDKAVPPEFRTKPKRKLLILVSGFLAFMISVFGVFLLEFLHKLEQKEIKFIDDIKNDINLIKDYINTHIIIPFVKKFRD